MKHETITNFPKRLNHSSPFLSLFKSSHAKIFASSNEISGPVREVLTKAWTAFAASGIPGLDWTPVSCTYMYSDVLKQGTRPVSLDSCATQKREI